MATWLSFKATHQARRKDQLLSNLAKHGFPTALATMETWEFDPSTLDRHLQVWDLFSKTGDFVDVHSGQVYTAPRALRATPAEVWRRQTIQRPG